MKVFSPATEKDVVDTFKFVVSDPGPAYIRLGKVCVTSREDKGKKFLMGKGVLLKEGDDISIISTGSILSNAVDVSVFLNEKGISARLISINMIKPIDKDIILKAIKQTKAIFTIEEHSVVGGLGSSVAGIIAESGVGVLFKMFGLPDQYPKVYGDRKYMLEKYGLSSKEMAETILKIWQDYENRKTTKKRNS